MIVEPVGVVGTEASALFGVDDASDAYAVEHLAGFAEGSAEDVSEDCEEGGCGHFCLVVCSRFSLDMVHAPIAQQGDVKTRRATGYFVSLPFVLVLFIISLLNK